jgi:hypothetical protein
LDRGSIRFGVLVSIAVGLIITLVTGLFRTLGTRMGVDVAMRGTPIPWEMQVFPMPARVLWAGFLTDLAFWIIISLIASTLILHYQGHRRMTAMQSPTQSI